jgi:hypothetical protein
MKKFIAAVSSPGFQEKFNGWSTIFFIVLFITAGPLGWLNSVVFVSYLSVYALITGSLSSWISSMVARKQDESVDGLTEDDRKWIKEEVIIKEEIVEE